MNPTIHIQTAHFTLPDGVSSQALDRLEQLMQSAGRATPGAEAIFATATLQPYRGTLATIGQLWPEQGGYYAGDFRADDGTVYGLIVADCGTQQDAGRAKWGPGDVAHSLSEWDGLANSAHLRATHPAAQLAAAHKAQALQDFYLPSRRELQLAAANVPHLFGTDSWYWSSTPRADDYAWAVDFEYGNTYYDRRRREFRVRPFRRFTY